MKFISPFLFCLLFISFLNAQTVTLELFANDFNNPVDIQNMGDDRLFVVEKGGRIKILHPDGTTNSNLFLDISSLVSTGAEQGLLGLTFHPEYSTNGYFFVNYTNTDGDTRVSRFSVDPADPDIALPGSQFLILEFEQPFSNHNGGGIVFGRDGYLYIAIGDGGSGGDPGNRAQNLCYFLGKLLRIDIDNPSGGKNYGIPSDNPFVNDPLALNEIWAYGLRNPWRFSFDSFNGDLWIGDVGQGDVEEIDRATSTQAGLNYGWRCYEGSSPYNTSGCPDPSELIFPFAEYSSSPGSGNCSITGGIVYRGNLYPDLQGLYFYADVCSGEIGTVDAAGNLVDLGNFGGSWVSFGVDFNEELYIIDLSGNIYRIQGNIPFQDNSISLSPNPASSQLRFVSNKTKIDEITICDIRGTKLFSESNISSSDKTIYVDFLINGIYIVKVETKNGQSFINKLVIE